MRRRAPHFPAILIPAWLLTFFCAFPSGTAQANSLPPAPDDIMVISVYNAPRTMAHVDVLVPLSEEDARYTACSDIVTETYGLKPDCGMVTFSVDGYRSSTAHLLGLTEYALADPVSGTVVCDERNTALLKAVAGDRMRVAVFSGTGRLLCCSKPLQLPETSDSPWLSIEPEGSYHYNAETGEFEQRVTVLDLMRRIIGLAAAALLTALIEVLVAKGLRLAPLRRVAYLNLCSNLLMNTVLYLLPGGFRSVLVTETVVCLVEFVLCRCFLYREVETWRIALLAIVGNIASFMTGCMAFSI